jgi:hypothetical protein
VWTSSRVAPGRPRASEITILGAATEKHTLTAMSEYTGGTEGASRWQWHRAPAGSGAGVAAGQDGLFEPIPGATSCRYRATRADLGHRLMVAMVPVRSDGVEGERVTALTEAVDTGKDGEWPLGSVELVGRCEVGSAMTAVVVYDGGVEGDSVFRWHRVAADGGNGQVIPSARGSTYTPADDDIGHFVRVDYYPVRSDGMRGDRAVAVSASAVGPATRDPPIATDVSIEDTVIAGVHSLRARYTYRCGVREGATVFRWFQVDVNGPPVPLHELGRGAAPATIAVPAALIGKRAYLEVTPVNALGHQGTTRTATTSHTIFAKGDPRSPMVCGGEGRRFFFYTHTHVHTTRSQIMYFPHVNPPPFFRPHLCRRPPGRACTVRWRPRPCLRSPRSAPPAAATARRRRPCRRRLAAPTPAAVPTRARRSRPAAARTRSPRAAAGSTLRSTAASTTANWHTHNERENRE